MDDTGGHKRCAGKRRRGRGGNMAEHPIHSFTGPGIKEWTG